jgi:NTP pyrophosphatase (non-canonical NTP hydrolase)
MLRDEHIESNCLWDPVIRKGIIKIPDYDGKTIMEIYEKDVDLCVKTRESTEWKSMRAEQVIDILNDYFDRDENMIEDLKSKLRRIGNSHSLYHNMDQLGEEMGELLQAMNKFKRSCGDGYSTTVSRDDAIDAITVEIADVLYMIFILAGVLRVDVKVILGIMNKKAEAALEELKTKRF